MVTQKFEKLSRTVWDNIWLSNYYRTIYGEETITDSLLLELVKQNFFNIRILQTPKNIESIKGTDWEWFVGSPRFGWIRFAIQAKKLYLKHNSYPNLNHKVGTPPHDDCQINILRTYSQANGSVPLYNFYNYYPQAEEPEHWHCSNPFDPELLGWTFTTLTNVQTAINTRGYRNFDKIHQFRETLPIRCLFTCPYFRSIYMNDPNIDGGNNNFLGEKFTRVEQLPDEFIMARETGRLEKFPEVLFKREIEMYPKRIAIIQLTNLE